VSKRHKKFNPPQQQNPNQPQAQFQIRAMGTHFSGPLPPPEILAKYNDALPNGAERIVAMAEGQMKHRQALENPS
jgi:uncharacterized membrane protein